MANYVNQQEVDKALVDLAELNTRGEVVSEEILEVFLSEMRDIGLAEFKFNDIAKLIKLLVDNSIEYSQDADLLKRLNNTFQLIVTSTDMDFPSYEVKEEIPLARRTEFYLDAIMLLDKIWRPSFEGSKVWDDEIDWLTYAELLNYPIPLVVERTIEVIQSRLPTTDEAWEIFQTESKDAYISLAFIGSSIILSNEKYMRYYVDKKTREYFDGEVIIATEWGEELFEDPLAIRYLE